MIQLDNDDFCPNLQKIGNNKVYSSNGHVTNCVRTFSKYSSAQIQLEFQ